ncbi:MAG TPA: TonB-dependent receptor [Porticoccaceae bacterium]|nr:TonB-dependent receptor [Porticoccaceae bacterium]HCO60222.1 TonB-dependent receptor [Porticoccaceae bacterium]
MVTPHAYGDTTINNHTILETPSSASNPRNRRIVMEEIIITQPETNPDIPTVLPLPVVTSQPDSGTLLKSLPGANINSNGPITGIAQYRGLYGDRVAVTMDNEIVLSGGPNAMDAPLSYAPPLLLESLALNTGITPVSESQESIGGHITATLDRGDFADTKDGELSGAFNSRYGSVDDGFNQALKVVGANDQHKVAALASFDEGSDAETGDGKTLVDTSYRRERYDLSYAWQNDASTFTIAGGKLDTEDTGTPALPMDILYIDTDIANFTASTEYRGITYKARTGYRHVDHRMDNFSLRSNANPMMYRQNDAHGRQFTWGGSADIPIDLGVVSIGIDGATTVHDALITNPNMAMFAVKNFADAERDIYGLFVQWRGVAGAWDLEAGARYNHVNMDSDTVYAQGMMAMMQGMVDSLAGDFNNSQRKQNFDNIDIVLKAARSLNDTTNISIGAGRKNRAPSYQELYLWLPLEATGGLADGRTYVGNLDLDSEVNHEFNIGVDWRDGDFYANGQVFFRKVDDFIQGTPSGNMTANMLAAMMSGQTPLQFNNIDAELYGFDGRYGVLLNDAWRLDGVLSYVRGENKDNGDNLYRITPLSHQLGLTWQRGPLTGTLESVLYARQSKTSKFNDEKKTAGYGLVNLRGHYQFNDYFNLSAGIENLLDKDYVDHLSGYNRNADSDIAIGDRLPGRGRNLFIAVNVNW